MCGLVGRAFRQLDHRRGLLKTLAAAVKHEVVVRRDRKRTTVIACCADRTAA